MSSPADNPQPTPWHLGDLGVPEIYDAAGDLVTAVGNDFSSIAGDMAIRMTYPLRETNKQFDTPTVHGDGGSGRKRNMPKFGQLNPDWVEWLMGWPVGHTDPERDPEPDARPLPDDPADLPPTDPGYVPRTTSRREHRAARIKALGNGQVPLCAAVALETMLETFSLLDRSIQHSAFSIQH